MLNQFSHLNLSESTDDELEEEKEPPAQLPFEIWIQIIQFLPYSELFSLATVCPAFSLVVNRELSRNPFLRDNVSIQRFLRWLKIGGNGVALGAESITMCPRHRSKPLFAEVLSLLVKLKEVTLDSTHPMSQEIDLSIIQTRSGKLNGLVLDVEENADLMK